MKSVLKKVWEKGVGFGAGEKDLSSKGLFHRPNALHLLAEQTLQQCLFRFFFPGHAGGDVSHFAVDAGEIVGVIVA